MFFSLIVITVFLTFALVFPVRTRTDYGVEVSILAQCQMFLRRRHQDVFAFHNAHYNGRSELNQVGLCSVIPSHFFSLCQLIKITCIVSLRQSKLGGPVSVDITHSIGSMKFK